MFINFKKSIHDHFPYLETKKYNSIYWLINYTPLSEAVSSAVHPSWLHTVSGTARRAGHSAV